MDGKRDNMKTITISEEMFMEECIEIALKINKDFPDTEMGILAAIFFQELKNKLFHDEEKLS